MAAVKSYMILVEDRLARENPIGTEDSIGRKAHRQLDPSERTIEGRDNPDTGWWTREQLDGREESGQGEHCGGPTTYDERRT